MKMLVGLSLVAVLVAGCGGEDKPEHNPFTVEGTVTLSADYLTFLPGNARLGDPCTGEGGYSDIAEGTSVVIRDNVGKKVGLGALGPGRRSGGDYGGSCTFDIKVEDVANDGGKIYSAEVSHRGEISFKRADAKQVTMTLGN